jgi:hypothetical protein
MHHRSLELILPPRRLSESLRSTTRVANVGLAEPLPDPEPGFTPDPEPPPEPAGGFAVVVAVQLTTPLSQAGKPVVALL